MKSSRTLSKLVLVVASCALLAGCKGKKKSGDDDDADSTSADSASSDSTASAKPAKKSAIKAFFVGPIPNGVAVTKGYTAYDPKYTMTIPKTWKTGGNRASGYMAMRRDSTAAVYCDWGGMSAGKIRTLAKRAPVYGKDIVISDEVEVFKMGTKVEFPARAGHGTGKLFKEDGGKFYWMDILYKDTYGGSATTGSVHCMIMVKASADETVNKEAQAIMRAFLPPPGHELIAERKAELFDKSKQKKEKK